MSSNKRPRDDGGAGHAQKHGQKHHKVSGGARNESGGTSTLDPVTTVYNGLVASRGLIASLELPRCVSDLPQALKKLVRDAQQLTRLPMDLSQFVDALRKLQTISEREAVSKGNIMRLAAALDECYYTLYYCVDVHQRSRNDTQRGSALPPPHMYFTTDIYTACGVGRINAMLKAYLDRSVSAGSVESLIQSWGAPLQSALGTADAAAFREADYHRKNPLLLLHFARWRETLCLLDLLGAIPDVSDAARLTASLRPQVLDSPASATMKGTDPLMPDRLRQWADSCRVWPCHLYAFATPNTLALEKIASFSPLVEIGAGTGYWSQMLRLSFPKCTVVAYDKDPPTIQGKVIKPNDYHGKSRAWTQVLKGGPEVAAQYAQHALFLCYPPPDNAMALLALRAYTGSTICYVGEWQGDTGTKGFEKLLSAEFACEERVPLPNWSDTCYSLTVWRRRAAVKTGSGGGGGNKDKSKDAAAKGPQAEHLLPHRVHPFACSQCGRGRTDAADLGGGGGGGVRQMSRCRLSYSVQVCSEACAVEGRDLHLAELATKGFMQRASTDDAKGEDTTGPLLPLTQAYFVKVPAPVIS